MFVLYLPPSVGSFDMISPQSQVYERQRVHAPNSLRTSRTASPIAPSAPTFEPSTSQEEALPHAGLSLLLERFETAKTTIAGTDATHLNVREVPLGRANLKSNRPAHGRQTYPDRHLWGEIITDPKLLRGKKYRREAGISGDSSTRIDVNELHKVQNELSDNNQKLLPPLFSSGGSTQKKSSGQPFPEGKLKHYRKDTTTKSSSSTPKSKSDHVQRDALRSPFEVNDKVSSQANSEVYDRETSPIFRHFQFSNYTSEEGRFVSTWPNNKPDKRTVRISRISGPIDITESSQPLIVAPTTLPLKIDDPNCAVKALSHPAVHTVGLDVPTNALKNLTILPEDPLFLSNTINNVIQNSDDNAPSGIPRRRKASNAQGNGPTPRMQRSRSRSRERRRSSNGSELRLSHRRNLIYSRPVRRRSTSSVHSQRRKQALSETRRKKKLKPTSQSRSEPFLPHYDEIPLGQVPPYCENLNKAVDLILFDPRYAYPVLRFNRKLINSTGELLVTITKLLDMHLLPGDIDIHEIRRVDDRKFNDILPELLISPSHRRRRRHRRHRHRHRHHPREESSAGSPEIEDSSSNTQALRPLRDR